MLTIVNTYTWIHWLVIKCPDEMASFYTQEVKIPGRKAFGFSYHSRLFVSAVEEGSAAADWLLPGDEIVQVRRYTLQRFNYIMIQTFLDQKSLSSSTPFLLLFPSPFSPPSSHSF